MSNFNFSVINFSCIDSTNSYAHQLLQSKKVEDWTVVRTDFQVQGKGQIESSWESEEGKNLLASVIIHPKLKVEDQFRLGKIAALGIKDYLDSLSVENVRIKWPNDILIGKKKIAGILIENSIVGKLINDSILGIGLNVNQTVFKKFKRPATSLRLETGQYYQLTTVLEELLEKIHFRYLQSNANPSIVDKDYLDSLYGVGMQMKFKDKEGEFLGRILTILNDGRIQLDKLGKTYTYELKELEFLI